MLEQNSNTWEQAFKPFRPLDEPVAIGDINIGDGTLTLIAGPCAVESETTCFEVAEHLYKVCTDLNINYIFKSSFDKANRTSLKSFRGHGLENGLDILRKVKRNYGLATLTDVHETHQVKMVAEAVDIVQIPAFLCRQTDLLVECGKWGQAVNIKKGQFLSPEDMGYAVDKIVDSGTHNVITTERGALFGYRDLVVDMRSLVIMRALGYPVVYDATHSVQQMGGIGGSSGGLTQYIPAQVRAAVAVGVDAIFVETHPDPTNALSDGSTMVRLADMERLVDMALNVHATHRQ